MFCRTQSLSNATWPQMSVKFHVNLIHRSEDIAIWIFRIFGLKRLFRPPKWGFWGTVDPKCDYSSSRPPKGTSLHKSMSIKLSTVKIRWGVWPVGELTESVTDTHTLTGKFIFCPCIALDRQQQLKKLTPLKMLMQEKIMQTSSANSEHKHSENDRLSTLNEQIISQNSKESIIVNCQ